MSRSPRRCAMPTGRRSTARSEQRASAGVASYSERGFNALRGSRAGMTHWVVSDLNRDELAAFAQSLGAGEAR